MNLDAIAVIGMAGRFPGAQDVARFWRNLSGGVESVTFFDREELARRGIPTELLDHPLYVKASAVLDGIEMFDADFFGLPPREAEITDPQHRVFLECAWEALEDSGYDPERYDGQIGVYAGAGLSTYLLHYVTRRPDVLRSVGELQLQLGNNKDYVPLRVSYKLQLRGPSVNVNTACSSSLVAVHLACQSLIDNQCDIALAGGVGIQVPQHQGYLYSPNGISSPDGHCRAFDARAQGTVSGNGAGIVVLKRHGEALADGDAIRAIILGSAINNDGGKKVGFTAPSVEGQARAIGEAVAEAEVDPATIGYIEAHGTGTPLGDPIEVAALTEVFRSYTSRTRFCALGSAKTNVGHLDEAAGVAGLIKTVLALQHAEIPPSLHFERPNPEIDFETGPFYVPTRLSRWDAGGAPRRAGVSSFGIGGTNAHVVLQEAPPLEPASPSRPWQLLLLSARTEMALNAVTARLAGHLRATPGVRLADAAYTLQVGRKDFPHRRMVLCRDLDEAVRSLERQPPDRGVTALAPSSGRSPVFLFPGQGSQHCDMGLALYRTEPVFRDTVDRCAERLTAPLGVDLRTFLYPEPRRAGEASTRLEQTALAQPVLFTVEYALAQLLMSWGIRPRAMSGHSVGEYVAACLAGVFSWEDALCLVAARGQLMQEMPGGGMLAMELAEDELLPHLGGGLDLALVNAPSLCVVAGAFPALAALEEEIAARGVAFWRLHTSHAFHSASMDPVLDRFERRVREVSLSAPTIPYVSNLTGRWITASEATDPGYWARHLRHTVRFSQGVRQLLQQEDHVFLEVGPGQTLCGLVRRHPECAAEHPVIGAMPHARDPRDGSACLLEAVGCLWLAGACRKPRDHGNEKRRRVALPTYPFERRRFWLEPPPQAGADNREATPVAAAGDKTIEDWFYVPAWQRRVPAPLRLREEPDGACWLVFLDPCGLGELIVERLRARGCRIVTVTAAAAFARRGEASYTLNPHQSDHYTALFAGLAALGSAPRTILHLWTVTQPRSNPAEHWKEAQYLGFYSLLFLVQAANRQGMAERLSLHAVSSHMQQVVGNELSCPEKATLLGPIRVMPKEFPGIQCRSIDLALPGSGRWDRGCCLDLLVCELFAENPAPVIAIRGNSVWEQAFAPRHLPAPAAAPARLREGGTYLITGGLGSMGLALARYLAREVRARLVLLGRTGLPPEAEWEDRLRAVAPNGGAARSRGGPLPSAVAFDPTAETGLVQCLEAAAEAETALNDIDADEQLQGLLRAFCSGLIGRYFGECGVALKKGRVHLREELRNRLNILPGFEKFLDFLLRALAEDGIAAIGGDRVEILNDRTFDDLTEVRQAILSRYPKLHGLVRLLEHCASQYRQALSGEIPSISVLYPDGTSAFLDECCRDTPEYARDGVYLKLAARLVARIAAGSAGEKLRILEVGGGVGGLTRAVLDPLKGRAVEYHFTDLGSSFVRRAEKEAVAGGLDRMHFDMFDISRDPEAQGYARHSFDIVLGYNVVHATPRIEEAVGHLRGLLAPGGLLLLVETTRLRRWDEMVWGLTEGWWHFTDEHLRTESPLIALDGWEKLMRGQGFDAVAAYPSDERARIASDVGLVIARQPSPLPEGDPQPAAGVNNAKTRAAIAAIRDIRKLGGEVLVLRADLADETAMRDALSQVRQRFGAPDGVIHTAGVLGQGLIHGKTPGDVEEVFRPKALGLLVLDKLLQEQGIEPDFLVLCSSLAAQAPVVGQVDYCAANAFLDAYAAYRTGSSRTAAIAIDWGFWQELGMIEQAKMPQASKQRILDEIRAKGRSSAGIEAFRCILGSCPPPQVLVSPDSADNLIPVGVVPADVPEVSGPIPGEPPHWRPVDHPWFRDCFVETAGIESYVSHLDIGHWVLNEHRPNGKAVLPGTAFLELARAALEAHGPGRPVQFSEVYFWAPLLVEESETKEVRTILKKRDDGFEFVVASRVEAPADEWHEHAHGEIAFLTTKPPPPQDLGNLKSRVREADIRIAEGDGDSDPGGFALRVRQFTPHWRNFETVRLGSGEGLATLQLAPEFAGELDALPLHPALADMGIGFMSMIDGFETGVPFCYERVRLWKPLPARVHSHVRPVANRRPGERTYDATILDGQGNVLLDVAGFTLREFGDHRTGGSTPVESPEASWNFCVEIDCPGNLNSLALRPDLRRRPGPGEVEIEVAQAGLNFIEVLYALGMLPDAPGGAVRFGLECAGRIAAVGEGVDGFRPGDEIFGFAPRAFSRFATTAATAIAHKPEHLTLGEAATLPAAFTTAYYALITQGRMKRGERVLIHAASGGVGLAAVNIAQWRGAEIFATAGTPAKREYLRGLGIRHVWDSRSLDFAAQLLEATQAKGVDLVLNSLGGEFIPASLSVLARYGRFLELGKRDIFRDAALRLAPFEKHLSFIAIDVGTDLPEFELVWRQVVRAVRRQAFRPLPNREFPVSRLAEAFDHMAQGKHIGKILVAVGGLDPTCVGRHRRRGRPLDEILGREAAFSPGPWPENKPSADAEPAVAGVRTTAFDATHARPAQLTAYRPPSGETERRVVDIWQELLGVSGIGGDDNFFELRGNSLLAAQVTSRLYSAFDVKLPLSSVFEHPTAAGLASRIEQLQQSVRELAKAPSAARGASEVEQEL